MQDDPEMKLQQLQQLQQNLQQLNQNAQHLILQINHDTLEVAQFIANHPALMSSDALDDSEQQHLVTLNEKQAAIYQKQAQLAAIQSQITTTLDQISIIQGI